MNMKIKLLLLVVISGKLVSAQVNSDEYLNALEITEKASQYYADEEYDKAYATFLEININDTAYIDSRTNAIECATIQGKYDTVLNLCEEVLSLRIPNPNKEYFYISIGHALLKQEKNQEAYDQISKSLLEFPRSYLLNYNRAVALYELERYDEAVVDLQTSIQYNPSNYLAHYKLGVICTESGHLTKAALCMNMALFLNAVDEKSIGIITALEAIYSGVLGEELKKVNFREEEEFDEIDLMLKNQIAKNSKYKVKAKLQYDFIKNNHLLFDQINFDENSNGFWNQNYIKFFKSIYNKGDFALYSYYQSFSIDNAKVQAVITKNKNKILEFIKWGIEKFTQTMNDRIVWNGKEYAPNKLKHQGSYGFNEEYIVDNGMIKGDYTLYNQKGIITRNGQFSNDGKVNGKWSYYDDGGNLEVVNNFNNGVIEGRRVTYYKNGSKQKVMNIKDDKINGNIITYYSFNQPYSDINYGLNGNEDGEGTYYHRNGEVSFKMNFSNGKLDGDYIEYYSNGKVKAKLAYVNGEKEGQYIAYHINGNIETEGTLENGLANGKWKFLHDNGQLKEEGEIKQGNRIGVWKLYNENGKLSSETDYGETGKKQGVYKEFTLDGELRLEMNYKGEEITSYKIFNSKGEVVSENEKKKKELEYVDYYENGNVKVEGNYYKEATVGTWKYYNQYGVLTTENRYNEEGELDGESKWYFDNGQLETVKMFEDGKVNGYFVDYFRNGKIYKHGWYLNDEPVGEWQYFYRDGTLSAKKYFLEGETHGDVFSYDEKGRLYEISQYYYGVFEGVITYDTIGNVTGEYFLKDGAATLEYKDMNGKPLATKTYVGAESNGIETSFFPDGTIRSKGNVIEDSYDGDWKWYDRKGRLTSEGGYIQGRRDGQWKWYHDNGKVSLVRNYKKGLMEGEELRYYENGEKETEKNFRNDERHGKSSYFDESGELQYVRYYQDGQMLGYSYLGKDKKLVAMIPFDNQNGTMEAYFSSGTKSYHSEYKDGFNQGKTVYYNTNGKEADVRLYDKNRRHGKCVIYYPTGKVRKESDYVEGDLHGEVKEYYANGKVKSIENYIMDELYGWSVYYKEDGQVSEKIYFYNGRQVN